MKIKKIKDFNFKHRYIHTVKRIQIILKERGYKASLKTCVELGDIVSNFNRNNDYYYDWEGIENLTDQDIWKEIEFTVETEAK